MDSIQLDSNQLQAVSMAASEPISLITGGPGTGKTTCLRAIITELGLKGRYYALCAPTGKAARRMSESTGSSAHTIHRLLNYSPLEGFRYNRYNQLPYSAIIVDESSMIDIYLMAVLLEALDRDQATVTFIGDADQLPPVGQGCPFRDLITTYEHANTLPVKRLLTPYRYDNWVAENAPRILAGEEIDLNSKPDFDFYQMETGDGPHLPGVVVDLVKQINDPDNTQVLTPTKQPHYVGSTVELNRVLQDAINPGKNSGWELNGAPIRVNSRVMQTRNNYTIGRFNGEVGKVVKIDKALLMVQYDNGITPYDFGTAKDLQLSYAATIHKSQGSEFDFLVIVLHSNQPTMLLTRQLFYTAITRAKKAVYIVGDEKGLNRARFNTDDTRRRTLLTERLKGIL